VTNIGPETDAELVSMKLPLEAADIDAPYAMLDVVTL
jgi:hypothetical protein